MLVCGPLSGAWLLAAVRGAAALGGRRLVRAVGRERCVRGLRGDLGVVDLAEALDQALPLLGLEHLGELLEGLARAVERGKADVDVVVVVGHREGRPPSSISEMIWAGRIVPCKSSRSRITASVIVPLPWF